MRHFRRMWAEALPEDRWIAFFLLGYALLAIGFGVAVYRWAGT